MKNNRCWREEEDIKQDQRPRTTGPPDTTNMTKERQQTTGPPSKTKFFFENISKNKNTKIIIFHPNNNILNSTNNKNNFINNTTNLKIRTKDKRKYKHIFMK